MDHARFAKVLSLAASENEAEALRAIQIAKRMLDAAGLDFVDLANLVMEPEAGDHASREIEELRQKLVLLRRENRHLKRSCRPAPETGGAETLASIERRLAAERSAREKSDAARAQLAAETRRLQATIAHLRDELTRSETERYRAIAEARKHILVGPRRPACRHAMSQYSLF